MVTKTSTRSNANTSLVVLARMFLFKAVAYATIQIHCQESFDMGKGNVVVPPAQVNDERTEDSRQQYQLGTNSQGVRCQVSGVRKVKQTAETRNLNTETLVLAPCLMPSGRSRGA